MPTCADRPETPRSDRSGRSGGSDSRPGMLLALALAVLGYQLNATMLSPALPDVMRRLRTPPAGSSDSRRPCSSCSRRSGRSPWPGSATTGAANR